MDQSVPKELLDGLAVLNSKINAERANKQKLGSLISDISYLEKLTEEYNIFLNSNKIEYSELVVVLDRIAITPLEEMKKKVDRFKTELYFVADDEKTQNEISLDFLAELRRLNSLLDKCQSMIRVLNSFIEDKINLKEIKKNEFFDDCLRMQDLAETTIQKFYQIQQDVNEIIRLNKEQILKNKLL